MENKVYIAADNIVSPLGSTTEANWAALMDGKSGLAKVTIPSAVPLETYAAIIPNAQMPSIEGTEYTRFETIAIHSIADALSRCTIDAISSDTIFIMSTTKGNIDMLKTETYPAIHPDRIYLSETAKVIASHFKNPNTPIVISNACISGVSAIITGARMVAQGLYKHAVVFGGDIINDFTVSGFQSFKALSDGPCKPFDANRTGLNLGEAFGALMLSAERNSTTDIQILGGAVSNDANHISGPSRDGSGLKTAIANAIKESGIKVNELGFISAHGTATPYNDEMEAIAFDDSTLGNIPVNSMKGYFGHTLGGAGIVETIISAHSLQEEILVGTLGYNNHGVSRKINIIQRTEQKTMSTCLKTASGFGGCNAALVLSK